MGTNTSEGEHKSPSKPSKPSGTKSSSKVNDKPSESHASKPERSAKNKKIQEKNKKNKDNKPQVEIYDASSSSKIGVLVSEPSSSSTKRAKFIVEPVSQWYTSIPPLSSPSSALQTPSSTQLSELNTRAAQLLTKDAETYKASSASTGNSAADNHFLQTILTKGTLSDRLSALTLLVQASPVHNTKALETLKGMAERGRGKGGREEGLKAVRCVVDWWVGGGAPDRKLRYVVPTITWTKTSPSFLDISATNHCYIPM